MIKSLEKTGRTEEEAVAAALSELHVQRSDVSVKILERARSGFLGIIGAAPAKVLVEYEVPDEPAVKESKPVSGSAAGQTAEKKAPAEKKPENKVEKKPEKKPAQAEKKQPVQTEKKQPVQTEKKQPAQTEKKQPVQTEKKQPVQAEKKNEEPTVSDNTEYSEIRAFLTGLLDHMGIKADIAISPRDNKGINVDLSGANMGAVIGRRGETLDAIQHLTNYVINRGNDKHMHISVDAESYRAKREESLVHLAEKMAAKVIKYKRSMALEPMNSYERHIIHTALQNYEGVVTSSTGTEPNRRVVVSYDRPQQQSNKPQSREWA